MERLNMLNKIDMKLSLATKKDGIEYKYLSGIVLDHCSANISFAISWIWLYLFCFRAWDTFY